MTASTTILGQCRDLMATLLLPPDFESIVQTIYIPLAQMILDSKHDGPLMVSINGAQGTGKSTMTAFLKVIIESELACRVTGLSLDDFYHTRAARERLASEVHPLLITRGVPGTHDVDLLESVLENLMNRRACAVPRFNKAIDDRLGESDWAHEEAGVEVILFEGWCNHSPIQTEDELRQPINQLEELEDTEGVWRHYVNEQLQVYHRRFFDQADLCIMLQVPDFDSIYTWRSLQEQKLRDSSPTDQQQGVLDEVALKRFIEHFERISRHTLLHLPKLANVVLPVNPDHSIREIIRRHD